MYDELDMLDVTGIVSYVKSLQQKDGSFTGDKWGEVDTRFSFCAVAILSLLGHLDAIQIKQVSNSGVVLTFVHHSKDKAYTVSIKQMDSLSTLRQLTLFVPA